MVKLNGNPVTHLGSGCGSRWESKVLEQVLPSLAHTADDAILLRKWG